MSECKETDVLIVGNGPSGISMSYLLSGWTPYYQPQGVPDDDLLRMKLSYQTRATDIPLTQMDMAELSEGLEGRTSNPVALVFDQLCHPYADNNRNIPSQLRWVKQSDKAVNHIVLGKEGEPGGVWQNIQLDLKTLSRSSWMELPDYPFEQYLEHQRQVTGDEEGYKLGERATVLQVRQYYADYVTEKGLSDNFLSSCLVTSVQKVPASPQLVNQDTGEVEDAITTDRVWEVTARRLDKDPDITNDEFCIRAKHVVLATGTNDVPNTIGIPGENLGFVKHGVTNVSEVLAGIDNDGSIPILVIGAGLSAADAILTASLRGFNVIHVFRETPCGNPSQMLKKLPKAVYPEYVHMYELMCGDVVRDWYKSYAQYHVHSLLDNNKVILENNEGDSEILEVSLVLVQIGYSPDLSFLPSQGTTLGVEHGLKIDVKHNPLDVNPFTNESLVESGLYAMGPLVGDNFIRFLKGGAIAIAQDIQKKMGLVQISG